MNNGRDKIFEELVQSMPKGRIIAAALLVMRQQRGEDEDWTPPMEELYDWIDELDEEHLLTLRDIAERL